MSIDLPPGQSRCPACGKAVDKLRAGSVAVYETEMVYYCDSRCKAAHLDEHQVTLSSPEPAPEPRRAQPEIKPSPTPSKTESLGHEGRRSSKAADKGRDRNKKQPPVRQEEPVEPQSPRRSEESPTPRPQPASLEESPEESAPGSEEPIETERTSAPSAEQSSGKLSSRLLLVQFFLGLILFAAALIAPSLVLEEMSQQIRLGLAGLAVVFLIGSTIWSLQSQGWRAMLEELLVTFGAGVTLAWGARADGASEMLVGTTAIAAATWFGRWLERVLSASLLQRVGEGHGLDDARLHELEPLLWGDTRDELEDNRWTNPGGRESSAQIATPLREELLKQVAAIGGLDAAPTGRWATRVSLFLAIAAIPLSLSLLMVLMFFSSEHDVAAILATAFVLGLTPRVLRRSWIGPLLLASGRGAKQGILFRNGAALEATARAHWVVFDAHGSLTDGVPEVTDILRVGELGKDELLALAAGVEMASGNSSLGQAIVRAAKRRGIKPESVRLARQTHGAGMSATSPKGDLLVGTRQLILGQGISVAEADEVAAEMESRAETVVFVAVSGRIQGVIGLHDNLRSGAEEISNELDTLGVEPVLMTGCSRLTADALGKQLGFENVRAEILPDQWSEQIRSMRETGNDVAMVTTPPRHEDALSNANVGLVLQGSGLEVESAGVALDSDDPRLAVKAVALARGALLTTRINLVVASVLMVAMLGISSLVVNLLLPAWLIPMLVALVAAVSPAILCSESVARPR